MTSVFRSSVLAVIGGVLLVAGCATDAPSSAPREGEQAQAIEGYIGQQGRLLLGFFAPDVRSFAFSVANTQADVNGRLSNGVIGGVEYEKVAITATGIDRASGSTTQYAMRIAKVVPPVAPATQWQYVLEQQDSQGRWWPACDEPQLVLPPLLPIDQPVPAIALPGRLTADGSYIVSATSVLFACKTGVIAKCDAWGYGAASPAPSATVSQYDMLQACSRMARADYCGSGAPNTFDGTPIHLDDAFHAQSVVKGYAFEAAWPGKASLSSRGSRGSPVVCLSKLRWSTLPLGGDCPIQVPDPRVNDKAKFCDELSEKELVARGALMFSSSSYIDAGLYTYVDPAGDLRLTTSKLQPQAHQLPPAWLVTPPAGMPFPIAGAAPPQLEATILAPKLPAGFTPDASLQKLVSYQCAGDMITSTTPPSDPSCAPIAMEGWVYPANVASHTQLRRWYNPATKHSWTTATSPPIMMLGRWQLAEVVGSVVRANVDVHVWFSVFITNPPTTYALDIQLRTGEWIPSCLTGISGQIATYKGTCVGNRAVHHSDIVAFRVTSSGGVQSETIAYDGVATDVYAPLAGGVPTGVMVDWNDVGNAVYALDILPVSGTWTRCADPNLIANDLTYFHDGLCATPFTFLRPADTSQIRVCPFDRTTGDALPCGVASYGFNTQRVHVSLSR